MPNEKRPKWRKILIIIGIIVLSIPFIITPEKSVDKERTVVRQKIPRQLSGILKIPAEKTVGKSIQGKKLFYRVKERIVLDVLDGNYKNLVFWNKNIPSIKITKKRTFIRGVPPGEINQIKLINTGKEEITVQARIIPGRS